MTGKMEIQRIVCYGYHGTHPAERDLGQEFIIDLSLTYTINRAVEDDQIDSTINYIDVYKHAKKIVETQQCQLLERLTWLVGQELMSHFPIIDLSVSITKAKIPVNANLEYVRFTLNFNANLS